MKRLWGLLAAVLLLAAGCAGKAEGKTQLVIFAAASLQETLTEIGEQYAADRGNVELVFNFDSSGTLKTQIQAGADCDLFLSAGQRQMDQLDASAGPEGNPEGLDLLLPDTRVNLLENQVVLAVPAENPAGIGSFADLCRALEAGTVLLALGNSDVPVGQYSQRILAYYSLDEAALAASGCVTYGSNAKEVATQVSEAVVDCGILYATDARSAGLAVVDTATVEMCGQVVYPAAVLTAGKNQGGARDFLAYLRTPAAAEVFKGAGFTPLA